MQVTITSRKMVNKFTSFYKENGLEVGMISLGRGTASSEVLDYFGLDGTEKSILFHIVTDQKWKEIKRQLRLKMRIDVPGVGIAFLIPLSSMGGKAALNYLTCGQDFVKEEETSLKDTKYELLIAIASQGYSEMIMDAARNVYAAGGTLIHARGTGSQLAEKFMGVTLVPEKDMLFIVVRKDQKNDVMRSIMEKAGTNTKAAAIVFSLPVTDTAGMRMMEELEELEKEEEKE
jgi:nitrogen regulatory protein PII